jgi:exodeoxyribonuclease VII small subunit
MTEKTTQHASRSFRDAYGILQGHAETLRRQDEPNIDDLLTIVTESVEAYRLCKERIDAVEAALKAALDGVATPAAAESGKGPPPGSGAAPPRGSPRAPPAPAAENSDDDAPF